MKSLNLLKTLAVVTLLTFVASLPAAAQQHKPAQDEVVDCPIHGVFDDTAFVVQCTDRWAGMLVPVPRVNGYSGFMFCGPLAATYVCYNDAVINVADHPEPLKTGSLSCTATWDDEALQLACKQE